MVIEHPLFYLNQIIEEINDTQFTDRRDFFNRMLWPDLAKAWQQPAPDTDKQVLELLAHVITSSMQMTDQPMVVFRAQEVAAKMLPYKANELVTHGCLNAFYALMPDPALLQTTILAGLGVSSSAKLRPPSDGSLSNVVQVAEMAIAVGGAIGNITEGEASTITEHPALSIDSRQRLLLNMIDSLPYQGVSWSKGQRKLSTMLLSTLFKEDMTGTLRFALTYEDGLATLLGKYDGAALMGAVVEENRDAQVLSLLYHAKESMYHAVVGQLSFQNLLVTNIMTGVPISGMTNLPHSQHLATPEFCLEAATAGLTSGRLSSEVLNWLEDLWEQCTDASKTLGEAVYESSSYVRDRVKGYGLYVKELDQLLDPEMSGDPERFFTKRMGVPEALERLYIPEQERVGATTLRRHGHLRLALHYHNEGMVEWAIKNCLAHPMEREVVDALTFAAGTKVRFSDAFSQARLRCKEMATRAVIHMAQDKQLRPWLAHMTEAQYGEVFSDTPEELTRSLRCIPWRDDGVKRQLLEDGLSM